MVKIRNWLLRVLAGGNAVVMNCHVRGSLIPKGTIYMDGFSIEPNGVEVEVREQTVIGADKPSLDEAVLYVNGHCLFHLEQLDDNCWRMAFGDPDGQYVRVILKAPRAKVVGSWDNDGPKDANLKVDGKETK